MKMDDFRVVSLLLLIVASSGIVSKIRSDLANSLAKSANVLEG